MEGILDRILAAQEKDGFLISYFIVQQREQRWEDLRLEHQMYNAGHFFEMAVAHHRLTGDPRPVPSDLYRVGSPQVPAVGLKLNGQTADASPRTDGYVHLQRRWQASDLVELDLPMPVHRVCAHEQVKDDQGQVALMRGPVVYCL